MIDCSLYFSTICYVRLSKITAALLLPRRESERIPLLQERCFPIASAKVGHLSIPCKTSPKKNVRKIHLRPFCYFIAWQNQQLSPFFRFTPSLSFSPQNRPFSSDSATFGAKTTFFGVFFSSAREIFSPETSFCAEKISLTRRISSPIALISTLSGEEKEEEVIFHPLKQTNRDENGHISLKKGERERKYKGECDETRTEQKKTNRPTKKDEGKMPKIPERKIKMGKMVLKQDSRDRKTKGHHEKAEGQDQKASVLHRKDQAQTSKTNSFLPLHHSTQKYKPTFSQNFSTFHDFLPCFSQNLPTPYKLPFNPTRRTRAYAYVRACALSEFSIFAFTSTTTTCNSTPCTTSIQKNR